MNIRSLVLGALSAATILSQCPAPEARAQEVCSVDEVSEALNGLSCFADGTYLSPESVAVAVSNLCYSDYSEAACYACFARARRKLYPTLKTFIKLGLVNRLSLGDYRNALADAEEETCYVDDGWPGEDGSTEKNSGKNSNGQRNKNGKR